MIAITTKSSISVNPALRRTAPLPDLAQAARSVTDCLIMDHSPSIRNTKEGSEAKDRPELNPRRWPVGSHARGRLLAQPLPALEDTCSGDNRSSVAARSYLDLLLSRNIPAASSSLKVALFTLRTFFRGETSMPRVVSWL